MTDDNDNWRDDPPSQKQLRFLRELGVTKKPRTKGDASEWIDAELDNQDGEDEEEEPRAPVKPARDLAPRPRGCGRQLANGCALLVFLFILAAVVSSLVGR